MTEPSADPGRGAPKPVASYEAQQVAKEAEAAQERAIIRQQQEEIHAGIRQRAAVPLRVAPPPWTGRLLGLLCVALIIGYWSFLTTGTFDPVTGEELKEARRVSPTILPGPFEVLAAFPVLYNDRGLVEGIQATLDRVIKGFGLAFLVGVPGGILAGAFPPFRAFLGPLEVFGRNIPVAALIPLTMVVFGIDEMQKIMFIFIACVPFVFYDAATSIAAVPQKYIETAETLGAKWYQIILKVLIPLAAPDIYNSLRLLFGLALGYIMLAELVNAEQGLGAILNLSQRRGYKEDIFAILIVISVLAFLIDRLLSWFHRGLFPYVQAEG